MESPKKGQDGFQFVFPDEPEIAQDGLTHEFRARHGVPRFGSTGLAKRARLKDSIEREG